MDAQVIGKKERVGYIGRLEGIWTIRPTLGGTGDRAVVSQWELRVPRTAIFRVNSGRHAGERMQVTNFIHTTTGIRAR